MDAGASSRRAKRPATSPPAQGDEYKSYQRTHQPRHSAPCAVGCMRRWAADLPWLATSEPSQDPRANDRSRLGPRKNLCAMATRLRIRGDARVESQLKLTGWLQRLRRAALSQTDKERVKFRPVGNSQRELTLSRWWRRDYRRSCRGIETCRAISDRGNTRTPTRSPSRDR